MKVSVIGGAGAMGQWFSKFFLSLGYDVTIHDINPKTPKIATELGVKYEIELNLAVFDRDIVLLATPIDVVENIMEKVVPIMKPGSLLLEIASVKKDISETMKELNSDSVELIGIHPMFGPATKDIKNQHVIIVPQSSGNWLSRIRKLFEDNGAMIEVLSAKKHDEVMAVVLGLSHFTYIAIGSTIEALDFDIGQSRKYMSPVCDVMMDFVGRTLGQDASLYATIQMNENIKKVRETFILQCENLSSLLNEGKKEKFVEDMERASYHFKDTELALKRSNELLNYRLKLAKNEFGGFNEKNSNSPTR